MRREPPREPSLPAFIFGCILILLGIGLSCASCSSPTEPNVPCSPFDCPVSLDTIVTGEVR